MNIIKHSRFGSGIDIWSPEIKWYWISWMIVMFIFSIAVLVKKNEIKRSFEPYFDYLSVPWKLLSFFVGLIFLSTAGYWTNDETWDLISGAGMSILTYIFAPLSIGIWGRMLFLKVDLSNKLLVKEYYNWMWMSLAISFFSFSWFYDAYLMIRDGAYTHRWYGNLILSSIIYFCAGLLWNLEVHNNKVSFGFLRDDWPRAPKNNNFLPLIWIAVPIAIIGFIFLVGFVKWDI